MRDGADSSPGLRQVAAALTPSGSSERRPSPAAASRTSPRVLFYSPDSWGLGHLRRALTLASGLIDALGKGTALVVTGSPCATQFVRPNGVGLVKLPSISKDPDGAYIPRSLAIGLPDLINLRSHLLLETFRAFEPDLVVVDHKVVGLEGEAFALLREARQHRVPTILGMRDVIDAPEVVAREWSSPQCQWALAEGYDRVCVYGTPEVFDPRAEYPLPKHLGDRVQFTGYVVREPGDTTLTAVDHPKGEDRLVVVTVGGGEDGAARISAYFDALAIGPAPWHTVVVAGPMMGATELKRLRRVARFHKSAKIYSFYHDMPRLLRKATAVVAMAGYNTAAEILQSGPYAVFLPRNFPRQEQAIRAARLSSLGLARSLPEPQPASLRRVVEESLEATPCVRKRPSLDGLRRFCDVASELLDVGVKQPSILDCRVST